MPPKKQPTPLSALKTSLSFSKIFCRNILASAVVLGAAALPVNADARSVNNAEPVAPPPQFQANNPAFRQAYPMRVFVKVAVKDTSGNTAETQAPPNVRQLSYLLPAYVKLVNSPAYADLIVQVRRTGYDLNFRVIDRKQKGRKYKKHHKYAGGPCGIFKRAFYTKIKEKGEAYARYNLKLDLKNIGRDREQFTLRSAKNFSYGTNLRAATNCGVQPTNRMPSGGVERLFRKSSPGYRYEIARKIGAKAANSLSLQLAYKINKQATYFYQNLAERLTYAEASRGGAGYYKSGYAGGPAYQMTGGRRGINFGTYIPQSGGGYGRW